MMKIGQTPPGGKIIGVDVADLSKVPLTTGSCAEIAVSHLRGIVQSCQNVIKEVEFGMMMMKPEEADALRIRIRDLEIERDELKDKVKEYAEQIDELIEENSDYSEKCGSLKIDLEEAEAKIEKIKDML